MKRIISVLIVLCLTLGLCSVAFAKMTITQQPETQTVKVGGSLSFKVKVKGMESGTPITWYFTNPATGEVVTGKKLSSEVKGLKVSNPNSLTITLKKIPEEMHGWTVYVHIGAKNSGVESQPVMILIQGKEVPEMPAPAAVSDAGDKKGGSTAEAAAPAATGPSEDAEADEPVQVSGPVTITASGKTELLELDVRGKIVGEPRSEITFEDGEANFYVRIPEGTEGHVQYVTVGGIRLTPEGEVTGMSVRGWKSSAAVSIKIQKPASAAAEEEPEEEEEPVDESDLVTVTCTNCRFTGRNVTFASEGQVPRGSTITVIASGGVLAQGYTVNGGSAEHKNEATFQMVVEGDTKISMQKQK